MSCVEDGWNGCPLLTHGSSILSHFMMESDVLETVGYIEGRTPFAWSKTWGGSNEAGVGISAPYSKYLNGV